MIRITGIAGIPEVKPGDDLARLIVGAAEKQAIELKDADVLVVAQKVVSKAEGRIVRLEEVEPSAFARRLATMMARDARLIEVVLRETRRIVRMSERVLIVETHSGYICANAGVDQSNVDGGASVTLLPVDPDASAARLRRQISALCGSAPAVIISDSFGRPWRLGLTNVALGAAGLDPLEDYRGRRDPHGYSLHATVIAVADELAAAAGLALGKLRRTPAAVVSGFDYKRGEASARELLRPPEQDLFR